MIKEAPSDWELFEGCYLTEELIEAIFQAQKEGVHLAELEPLGLTERTTNALEHVGIRTLGDLVFFSWEELKLIKNIGGGAKKEIFQSISTLLRLEELAAVHIANLMPNKHKIEAIRNWGLEAVLAGTY